MTQRPTYLDGLMTQLRLENHELAAKVGTNRQSIWKLRTGLTRMLPNWAKRLAPHLGVSWQELVDGIPSPADRMRAELLAAFDAMGEDQQQALLTMARAAVHRNPEPEPEPQRSATRPRAVACVMSARKAV